MDGSPVSADRSGDEEREAARAKARKLLRLALDSAAADGETANAATSALRLMKRRGLSLADVADPEPEPSRPLQPQAPIRNAERFVMPWGKWRGETIGWIRDNDRAYLEQLATRSAYNNYNDLRQAVQVVWTHCK